MWLYKRRRITRSRGRIGRRLVVYPNGEAKHDDARRSCELQGGGGHGRKLGASR